jgi:hypothetical protein
VSESVLSPEQLRRGALDALGPYADERARSALQEAVIRVDHAVTSWQSSHGPVEGHRVVLAVHAATLARLRSTPSLIDALHAALATAVARRSGEALVSLDIGWARDGTLAMEHGYRDPPPEPPQTFPQALASYLEELGDAPLARMVEGAQISREGALVTLVVEPELLRTFRSRGAAAAAALTSAVRELAGDAATRVLRVVVQG